MLAAIFDSITANGEGVERLEPCEDWRPYVVAAIPKPVTVAPDDDDGGCHRSGRRDSNPLSAAALRSHAPRPRRRARSSASRGLESCTLGAPTSQRIELRASLRRSWWPCSVAHQAPNRVQVYGVVLLKPSRVKVVKAAWSP
jgi:hypothetical protein